MGNYLSCTLPPNQAGKPAGGARVLLPSGEIRVFSEPVTAADLMMEAPNNFLVSAASLRVGCRFEPLPADEELELGQVYAMLPMKRVGSIARAGDVGSLSLAAQRQRRGKSEAARVMPEACGTLEEQKKEESGEAEVVEFGDPLRYRFRCSRFKRLTLDTIKEEEYGANSIYMLFRSS